MRNATSAPAAQAPSAREEKQPLMTAGDGRSAVLAALADALAGALGSVVAVAVFYPIDIAKTRAQASCSTAAPPPHPRDHDAKRGGCESRSGAPCTVPEGASASRITSARGGAECSWFRSRTLAALLSIVRTEGGLTRLYEGIEAKALQALLGSFVYFYAYAFIKGAMRRRLAAAGSGGGGVGTSGAGIAASNPLRPSLNLLAAALAGAVNQAFTLPLENITTRMQTGPQHAPQPPTTATVEHNRRHETEARREGTALNGRGDGVGGIDGISSGDTPKRLAGASARGGGSHDGGGVAVETLMDTAPASWTQTVQQHPSGGGSRPLQRGQGRRGKRRPRQSVTVVTGDLYREGGGMGRFWRGFVPSLILTCNPAINYTAFDMLKALWLRRRNAASSAAVAGTSRGAGGAGFLNPIEAFLVAAAAKSLATLITYPLIRAKVVLMTSPSTTPARDAGIVGKADNGLPTPSAPWTPAAAVSRRRERNGEPSAEDLEDDGSTRNVGVATATADSGGVGSVAAPDLVACTNGMERQQRPANGEICAASVLPMTLGKGSAQAAADGSYATAVASGFDAVVIEERGGDRGTRGMGKVLMEILRREGLGGLYAGCGAQLLHTILKSALLLATKEQIARAAASAVFLGASRGGPAGHGKPPHAAR